MRIIVKLFSLVVVIVKSQSSQSRSHFSRSGYHHWCPYFFEGPRVLSHSPFPTRSVPPDLQKFITLGGAPRPASVPLSERSPSSGSSEKSPQLSSDPSHTPSHVSFSLQLQFYVIYLVVWLTLSQDHKLEEGVPVLCIAVSPRHLVQSLMFHGYLLDEYHRDFTGAADWVMGPLEAIKLSWDSIDIFHVGSSQ